MSERQRFWIVVVCFWAIWLIWAFTEYVRIPRLLRGVQGAYLEGYGVGFMWGRYSGVAEVLSEQRPRPRAPRAEGRSK